MFTALPTPAALPIDTAILLVLLPMPASNASWQAQADTFAALRSLQIQLGAAIRVLVIDEASHATVVRSFRPTDLPAFVLSSQANSILHSFPTLFSITRNSCVKSAKLR